MMRVTVDDAAIEVATAGSGDAVVLLHGFPLTREIWNEPAAKLAQGHFVIRPDLRGMGASSVPDGPYLMETLAGDVAAVLDTLGIERAAIVGHSLGGYVAMAFCRMYSERVDRLALICSRLAADSDRAAHDREALADRAESELRMEIVTEAYAPKLVAESTVREHPEVLERVRSIASANTARGAAAMLRGMAQRVESYDIAEELEMPVLIVAGDADRVVPLEEAEEMRRAFPHAALTVIQGAGHVPMLEQPQAFTARLLEFLN